MIDHALTIVRNEMVQHLAQYGGNTPYVELGNVGEAGQGPAGAANRERLLISVVNIQEERSMRNAPAYVRDDATLRIRYENPPVCLNLAVLVAATHARYDDALRALSRAILFFQHRNAFTQDDVHPQSLVDGAPGNDLDRLSTFRLSFALWSPSFEEVNDLWGMLGGKQFPSALYSMRMLELQFRATHREAPAIGEIATTIGHRTAVS